MGLACCTSDSKQFYEDVDDEDGDRRKSDPFYSRFVDDGDTMSRSSSSERERSSSRSSEKSREIKKESRRKSRRHRKSSADSSHSDSDDSRSPSRTRKKKPKPVAAKKSHRDRRKSGRHKYERVRSESVSSCSSSRSDENTSEDGRGSMAANRRESRRERDKSYRSRKESRKESKYHAVSRSKSHRSKHDKHSKHKKKHKGSTTPKTFAEVLSENYASSLPDIPEHSYMSDSHSLPKHKHKEKEKIKHRKLLAQYRESNNTLSSTPSYYRQKTKLTAESSLHSGRQSKGVPSIRSTLTSDVDGRMSETHLLKNLSDAPVEPRSTPSIKLKKKKKKKDKERGKARTKVLSLFQRGEQVLFQGERCLVMKVTKEIPPIYTVRSERSRQRYQTDACKLSAWKPNLPTESSVGPTSVSVMLSEEVPPRFERKRSKHMERSSTRERSRDRSESRGRREREKPKRKKKKKKKKKKYREGRHDSSSEGRIRDRSIPREGEESIVLKLYE